MVIWAVATPARQVIALRGRWRAVPKGEAQCRNKVEKTGNNMDARLTPSAPNAEFDRSLRGDPTPVASSGSGRPFVGSPAGARSRRSAIARGAG